MAAEESVSAETVGRRSNNRPWLSHRTLGSRLLGPRGTLKRREAFTGLASMVPALFLVGFVVWYPVARTFQYSFTDWNGASSTWVGIDNYADILTGSDFWTPLRNNAIFLFAIPGILVLSLIVAVLLFEQVPGWRFFRSVYYLPTILSAAVVGMLMRTMFNSRGVVNSLLDTLGLELLTRNWLGSVPTAFVVLIFAFYWQTLGQGVLIFLAGLASIPSDIIEASQLDGASWWQRLWQIIVPMLIPTVAYFTVINAIWAFVGVFALVYTVTEGGPGYGTTPLDLMIYRRAFQFGEMGYASAMSVLLFCLVLAISAIQLRVFDRLTTD
jgi:multiple sugar transport system permease protein